jgi:hypothetical protein
MKKLLTVVNAIHDALRPVEQMSRLIQFGNFLDEPHIAHLSVKDERHRFGFSALFCQERHMNYLLEQWKSSQWLEPRIAHVLPAHRHPDSARLVHRDDELRLYVFQGDLTGCFDPPSSGKTLLVGFKGLYSPDFCHTFSRECDAKRFMQRWLAQARQEAYDQQEAYAQRDAEAETVPELETA